MIRDSSVGITIDYGLNGRGSIPDTGKIFVFSATSRPDLMLSQPVVERTAEADFPGVKRQEREADHSSQLVPWSRMVEAYLHCIIRLHGVVLN
jgi:hypothetical protein